MLAPCLPALAFFSTKGEDRLPEPAFHAPPEMTVNLGHVAGVADRGVQKNKIKIKDL